MSEKQTEKTVVALGNFDGLHLGHRRLIEAAVSVGSKKGWLPTVWCFDPHPAVFLGKAHPGLLMQKNRKEAILSSLGIRQRITADFSAIRDLSPEEFTQKILTDELGAAHVVCGFNYSFGKNAEGDFLLLQSLLKKRGIGLTVVAPVNYEGEPISSSRIRRLVQEGQLSHANAMLDSPIALEGEVEIGKRLGRSLGFPTANLPLPTDFVALRHGVYATRVTIGDSSYPAITNVGLRPTVEGGAAANCESHLLGFEGDLYHSQITCEFLHFIRPERRFDTVEGLKKQISLDVQGVKRYFELQG